MRSGVSPIPISNRRGWILTNLFENYLLKRLTKTTPRPPLRNRRTWFSRTFTTRSKSTDSSHFQIRMGRRLFAPAPTMGLNGNTAPCNVRDGSLFSADLWVLGECGGIQCGAQGGDVLSTTTSE